MIMGVFDQNNMTGFRLGDGGRILKWWAWGMVLLGV